MTIRITHIRFGGTSKNHQSIDRFYSVEDGTGNTYDRDKATMVDWVGRQGISAYVQNGGSRAEVGVVQDSPPYLRTKANGYWTDNLLSLPTF